MASSREDLIKVSAVLLEFFALKRIRTSITNFRELGVTGWEKWWQAELAVHLAGSDEVTEWVMEHPFNTDRRTSRIQTRMSLDIGFRLKRHRFDTWYFVELKQHDSYQHCVRRMVNDAEKAFSARRRSFDGLAMRYVACAGVCVADGTSREDIAAFAVEQLDQSGLDAHGVLIDKVGKHHQLIVF